MQRVTVQPRRDWQATVESQGFHFHTLDDQPYWDESACYLFSSAQVDQIEQASYAINDLCLKAVDHIITNHRFEEFQIPSDFIPWITESWDCDEFTLYGRFDLCYDGTSPPKLLEYNADTPTSLLEAAVIQWFWFKELEKSPAGFSSRLPAGRRYDQFNSIHERLIEAWKAFAQIVNGIAGGDARFNRTLYLSSVAESIEDFMTVSYLTDTAMQAGFQPAYISIEHIGYDHQRGLFVDETVRPIDVMFKLYPWEWLIREDFGPMLLKTAVRWLEPPWKMLLSNKAILPILHELFPDSPYILPASFRPLPGPHVRKPTLSREGANIRLTIPGRSPVETDGPYGEPYIYQQLAPLRAWRQPPGDRLLDGQRLCVRDGNS
jgi:glutathionylspermidine synthase